MESEEGASIGTEDMSVGGKRRKVEKLMGGGGVHKQYDAEEQDAYEDEDDYSQESLVSHGDNGGPRAGPGGAAILRRYVDHDKELHFAKLVAGFIGKRLEDVVRFVGADELGVRIAGEKQQRSPIQVTRVKWYEYKPDLEAASSLAVHNLLQMMHDKARENFSAHGKRETRAILNALLKYETLKSTLPTYLARYTSVLLLSGSVGLPSQSRKPGYKSKWMLTREASMMDAIHAELHVVLVRAKLAKLKPPSAAARRR